MRKPPAPAPSQVYDLLFPESGKTQYIVAAIVDPSLWSELDELLRYHSPEWYVLYDRRPSADLIQVLPRIVRLEPDSIFTGIVLREYGKRRNIYLRAEVKKNRPDLCDLVTDLKTFAHVKMPGNEWSWLRYYDPTIFCHLMLVATDPQKKCLFGPRISSFFAESTWDGKVIEFTSKETDSPAEQPVFFTPEQKEAFDELHFINFKREMASYILDAYFPAITAEKQVAAISAQIHDAVELSLQHGAAQKNHYLEFVKFGAVHGFECYSTQPINEILMSDGNFENKMQKIRTAFHDHDPNMA